MKYLEYPYKHYRGGSSWITILSLSRLSIERYKERERERQRKRERQREKARGKIDSDRKREIKESERKKE